MTAAKTRARITRASSGQDAGPYFPLILSTKAPSLSSSSRFSRSSVSAPFAFAKPPAWATNSQKLSSSACRGESPVAPATA